MAKKAKRKVTRAPAAPLPTPIPTPISGIPPDPTTTGEIHLAYFEREAALSRAPATTAGAYSDDADPDAWGIPGRTIIAEGDSWFDYDILGPDLIDLLRSRHKCHVIKNFARHGDTLENMVYGTEYNGAFQRRTPQFDATVALVAELRPRASSSPAAATTSPARSSRRSWTTPSSPPRRCGRGTPTRCSPA